MGFQTKGSIFNYKNKVAGKFEIDLLETVFAEDILQLIKNKSQGHDSIFNKEC